MKNYFLSLSEIIGVQFHFSACGLQYIVRYHNTVGNIKSRYILHFYIVQLFVLQSYFHCPHISPRNNKIPDLCYHNLLF